MFVNPIRTVYENQVCVNLNGSAFGNRAAGRGGCRVTRPMKRQIDNLIFTD